MSGFKFEPNKTVGEIEMPNDDDDDLYDHDFDPVQVCMNCDELEEDCECDDPFMEDGEECAECGMPEDDEAHG